MNRTRILRYAATALIYLLSLGAWHLVGFAPIALLLLVAIWVELVLQDLTRR